MKKVREVLAVKGSQVFSVRPDASVLDALALMAEKDIGALVIIDAENLVGIMSERDYARKVIMHGKASRDTLVRDIMTTDVLTVDPERPLEECMRLMATWHYRHLPVVLDGRVVGVVSISDLVKEMMAEQEQTIRRLASVASRDALTGLFNRSMFTQRLQQAVAQAERHPRTLGVLFIDLDGFKLINDMQGHEAGDHVLAELAARLQRSMREGDTLGRLGGDEFVVLIEDATSPDVAEVIAQKVITAMQEPVPAEGHALQVATSIGIAYTTAAGSGRALIALADKALYDAKAAGRNTWRLIVD